MLDAADEALYAAKAAGRDTYRMAPPSRSTDGAGDAGPAAAPCPADGLPGPACPPAGASDRDRPTGPTPPSGDALPWRATGAGGTGSAGRRVFRAATAAAGRGR